MADGAGCGVDFFHIGGDILLDLFCYLFVLDRVGPGSKDIMEELEGVQTFDDVEGINADGKCLATSEKARTVLGPGEWSHREPASYAGKDGSSRESHRTRSDSPCTGACACGKRRRYRDDYRGCA